MVKTIRNAVRCYLIKDNKVVCIKYLKGRVGYYDIPGGKIEEREKPIDAVKREFLEEAGVEVINPIYRGKMSVAYPDRIYKFKVFLSNEYRGTIKDFDENTTELKAIGELLKEEKRFPNTVMLESFFIKILLDQSKMFDVKIITDENDKIKKLSFKYI